MSARKKKVTRRKRGADRPAPAPAKTSRPGSAATRNVAILFVVAMLVVAGYWWLTRGASTSPQPAAVPRATLPVAAIIDSQEAAVDAQRWAASVEWASLLAEREPNDPMRMLGVGMALHNWAWGGGDTEGRSRTASRTSLDRVRLEKRALAILDSAVAYVRTPDEAARVLHWMGQIHEIYGLPVEAALGYQEALLNSPGFELSVPRAQWVMKRLRDPLGSR